jgi:octaprenyl-diphosphate synthase
MSFPFDILLERVQSELCAELLQQTHLLRPLMAEIVASTGKYVRTHMILRIAQLDAVYTDTLGTDLVTLCKGIECLHTASLLHDDVLDQGVSRRHRPCFYRQWGEKHAILLGDHLLSTALAYILSLQSLDLMHEIQSALNAMTRGQIQEHMLSWESPIEAFKEVTYLKTASLFEACAACASLLLGHVSSAKHALLKHYGKILGLCFQVQDDVADYYRCDAGKNRFQDFFQERRTLPLAWLMQHMNGQEQAQLKDWCTDPTESHAQCVYQSLQQYQIAEHAGQWMDQQLGTCTKELEKHWPKILLDNTLVSHFNKNYSYLF